MDIEHFRNTIVLAETKNMSKAAELLFISQPALTKQIKALENHYGCDLFARTSKGLQLTEYGELFLTQAKQVIKDLDILQQNIEKKKMESYHRLIIGHSTVVHREVLEKGVLGLYSISSNLDLSLRQGRPYELIQMLKDEEIDCAVINLPSARDENGIDYITLRTGGMCVRLGNDDPLAKMEDLSLRDLRNRTLLMAEDRCPKYELFIRDAYERCGISPKIRYIANKAVLDIISGMDDSISLTSEYNQDHASNTLVKIRELSEGFDIVLAYKKSNRNPLIHHLAQLSMQSR